MTDPTAIAAAETIERPVQQFNSSTVQQPNNHRGTVELVGLGSMTILGYSSLVTGHSHVHQ